VAAPQTTDSQGDEKPKKPSRGSRFAVAVVIGMAAGGLTLYLRLGHFTSFADFDSVWLASRAIARGENPYIAVHAGYHWSLHYPLPAVLVGSPFSLLPEVWASAAWCAVGFALLAYGLTSSAWWPLIGLASYPAVDTAQLAQWSALLTTIAVMPSLAFLTVAKPTTAGVLSVAFMHRTLRRPAIYWSSAIGVALVLLSFWLRPHWVAEWLAGVRSSKDFTAPIFRPGGALLLLALLRWRRPEARLVALLALAPQTMSPYDALPLLLVYSNRREALAGAWLGLAAIPFLLPRAGTGPAFTAAVDRNAPVLLLTLYLPALILVLRRPNVGPLPAWADRWTRPLPQWLRGTATMSPEGR
jgi:hypothetical protein